MTILLWIAIALVVATLLVRLRARRKEAQANADWPPEGQMLDVGGVLVHAVVMGEGPDLVLIHGTAGNWRDMTLTLAPMLATRYRVIVFDRPGLGHTGTPAPGGTSITDQARILADAARQLGAERPLVMGHSYGGTVGLAWAVDMPDRMAALISVAAPSIPWDSGLSALHKVSSRPLGRALVVPAITAFVSDVQVSKTLDTIFAPQPVPEGYARDVASALSLRRASLTATGQQRANLLGEVRAMEPCYPQITVPVELLHGTEDQVVSHALHSDPLAPRIPGANYVTRPGMGHMLQHVDADAVVAAIDRAAARAGLR